ncbi:MAG: hypothetical protein OQK82_00770 [Candidatus Pacearchaeota archaeon]|nr:hypothetical protein [Candidatus Pacearchaeota archaeon]
MKKVFSLILVLMIFSFSTVLAERCDLEASMINQDPYPAIQGDYVKLVFQLDGIANPECGTVNFELVESYPIIFDAGENPIRTIDSGTYAKDFSSFLLATFKVRVDANAVDGDNPIEVRYKYSGNEAYETKQFNLNVEDTRADFEIHVKNYDSATNTITFEVLNIGKSDIEALTLEIPKQDNIEIKGSNINIVGDLDSNEYTTADFEATPKEGDINIKLIYTDNIGERRSIAKNVEFDPDYFQGRVIDEQSSGATKYIILLIVIGVVAYYFYRRYKKNKIKEMHRGKH